MTAEGVVDVDEELSAAAVARGCQLAEGGHDRRVLEQDRRDENGGGPLVRLGREPLGERLRRARGHDDDLQQLLLGEARQQSPQGVELAVGRHETRSSPEVECRQEAQHEPERVLVERDLRVRLVEPQPETLAHALRLLERAPPLLVDVERRVVPGLDDAFPTDVGPGLVRVAGQEQTLPDAEARVVRRELLRPDQSSERTVQRSGKNGLWSVERR